MSQSLTISQGLPTSMGACEIRHSVFSWLTIVVIASCFWFVDHGWTRSIYYADMDEETYTGAENETADRLSEISGSSSTARVVLTAWSFLCFATARNIRIRWSAPLIWTSCLLLLVLLASTLWSINPTHTLYKFMVLLSVFVSSIGIAFRFPLKQFLEMVAVVCLIYIGFGFLAELSLGTLRMSGDYRFIGTSHPNTQAIYGALLCLISRQYLATVNCQKLTGGMLFLAGIVIILLTKSRTTLAGALVAILATHFLSSRGTSRVLLAACGLLLAGVAVIGIALVNQQASQNLGDFAAMGRTDDVTSLTGRLPLWEELVRSIYKSPIVGYGYLAFWDADRVEYLSDTFKWEIPHGHNLYLDTLLDVGVVGLLIMFVWFVCGMWTVSRMFTRTWLPEYSVVFGICIYAIINGFAESLFKLPGYPLFVILTCFSGLVLRRSRSVAIS